MIKYATDITSIKEAVANAEGQLAAIRKAQAVIEFDLNGKILDANDNFLNALGYRIERSGAAALDVRAAFRARQPWIRAVLGEARRR